MDALRAVNRERVRVGVAEIDKCTVYRYVKGATHNLGTVEARGRRSSLSKADVRKLDLARRRLIKRANNQARVTYAAVVADAALPNPPCQRVCEDALRAQGVGYRDPRNKIYISEQDAKARLQVARAWAKRPAKYWVEKVHAYVDNKAFPLPLTAKQRLRFRQTLVTGHLRKACEGVDNGFTKPREKHCFTGIPSVTISPAVAKDKVIMWHAVHGKWNAAAAAEMYEKHLKPALVRTWGKLARYRVVEDGDRKGNTSGKGIEAKARCNIAATTLPPRTPSLMPLDYAVWHAIVKRVAAGGPKGQESKESFLERLAAAATSLPKGFVKSVIARMKPNILALVDARGYTPKND